jgi:hypothetical protein
MVWTQEARSKAQATIAAKAALRQATGRRLADAEDAGEPIAAVSVAAPRPEAPVDDYRAQRIAALKERRQHQTHEGGLRTTLHIPENLKRPDMNYYFFNDQPGAGYLEDAMANKFYDPVACGEMGQEGHGRNGSSRIERYVGSGPDGKPVYAVLCCKPKVWYDEDTVRQNAAHEELMDQISRREPVLAGEAGRIIDANNAERKSLYVPREGRLPPA